MKTAIELIGEIEKIKGLVQASILYNDNISYEDAELMNQLFKLVDLASKVMLEQHVKLDNINTKLDKLLEQKEES